MFEPSLTVGLVPRIASRVVATHNLGERTFPLDRHHLSGIIFLILKLQLVKPRVQSSVLQQLSMSSLL